MPPRRCNGLQNVSFDCGPLWAEGVSMAAFDASLEDLYTGFLDREPEKSNKFRNEISAFCNALIRRYGWSLPNDVQDEIVGETLCALLSPSARRYDPTRGTFKEYLTGFVLNAARR